MKTLLKLIFAMSFILYVGCNDNGNSSDTNPLGIGNDGNNTGGTVTFKIETQKTQQDVDGDGNLDNVTYFTATPSVTITITKATYSLPAQQYTDSVTDDGTTEYQANVAVDVVGFYSDQITGGQNWEFQFEGKIVSNGQAFNVTSKYTVP